MANCWMNKMAGLGFHVYKCVHARFGRFGFGKLSSLYRFTLDYYLAFGVSQIGKMNKYLSNWVVTPSSFVYISSKRWVFIYFFGYQ